MLRARELQTAKLAHHHGNHELPAGRRPHGGGSGLSRDGQGSPHRSSDRQHHWRRGGPQSGVSEEYWSDSRVWFTSWFLLVSGRQMLRPLTCHLFFKSACPSPNRAFPDGFVKQIIWRIRLAHHICFPNPETVPWMVMCLSAGLNGSPPYQQRE